jgi:hypothetical protein
VVRHDNRGRGLDAYQPSGTVNGVFELVVQCECGRDDAAAEFTVSARAKLQNTVINVIWGRREAREFMRKHAIDNSSGVVDAWDRVCRADSVNTYEWRTSSTSGLSHVESTTIECTGTPLTASTIGTTWSVGDNGLSCGISYQTSISTQYLVYSLTTSYTGGSCGRPTVAWYGQRRLQYQPRFRRLETGVQLECRVELRRMVEAEHPVDVAIRHVVDPTVNFGTLVVPPSALNNLGLGQV